MHYIGGITFSSKKKITDYVRNMIERIGVCSSLQSSDIESYNFLIDLFRRHTEYPEKLFGMIDIAIVPNEINNKQLRLDIIKENGDHDNISWMNCVNESKKSEFEIALRFTINNQLQSFRQNYYKHNGGILQCAICQTKNTEEYHVDHINHFEQIKCEFLQTTSFKRPTKFRDVPGDLRKTFIDDDKPFEDSWKFFHQSNAELRILCASCNLKRPKWKQNQL
jgi:5-methylcytosine-specific restriction endonuclease McrA